MKLRDLSGGSFFIEAAYPGNIGAMEVFKFYKVATPSQKRQFDQHLANSEYDAAWALIQDVTGVKLQGFGKK